MKILDKLGHDSGASLVIDGYLKFAINEERLSRKNFMWVILNYLLTNYYQKLI